MENKYIEILIKNPGFNIIYYHNISNYLLIITLFLSFFKFFKIMIKLHSFFATITLPIQTISFLLFNILNHYNYEIIFVNNENPYKFSFLNMFVIIAPFFLSLVHPLYIFENYMLVISINLIISIGYILYVYYIYTKYDFLPYLFLYEISNYRKIMILCLLVLGPLLFYRLLLVLKPGNNQKPKKIKNE